MWKTLIPVDESPNALRAVAHALKASEGCVGHEFVLLNVQTPFPLRTRATLSQKEIERITQEEGAVALNPARALLDKAGVPCIALCISGKVEDVVVEQVAKHGCNAVTMGTRGAGAVGNLVLGSVATKVVHAVNVPVTLVK